MLGANSPDTSREAAEAQLAAYRRLSSGRVAIALSKMTRARSVAGIRRRRPGLSEAETMRELIRHLHDIPQTRRNPRPRMAGGP